MPRGRSKAYANRTDLTGKVPVNAPTGMPYGENKKLRDAQKDVPMANLEVQKPSAAPAMQAPQVMPEAPQPVVPLTEPTQFPNESITTGIQDLKMNQADPDMTRLKSYLPLFKQEAISPTAPETFRNFVKWLDQA
jgi:hypothetical protein